MFWECRGTERWVEQIWDEERRTNVCTDLFANVLENLFREWNKRTVRNIQKTSKAAILVFFRSYRPVFRLDYMWQPYGRQLSYMPFKVAVYETLKASSHLPQSSFELQDMLTSMRPHSSPYPEKPSWNEIGHRCNPRVQEVANIFLVRVQFLHCWLSRGLYHQRLSWGLVSCLFSEDQKQSNGRPAGFILQTAGTLLATYSCFWNCYHQTNSSVAQTHHSIEKICVNWTDDHPPNFFWVLALFSSLIPFDCLPYFSSMLACPWFLII